MKVHVDQDTCTGCGLCPDLCPEVFEMEGDVATVKVGAVPAEAEESCREAESSCPVDAIRTEPS
ncbi:MAG: ferredoxin [Planctomycetota bacterium]